MKKLVFALLAVCCLFWLAGCSSMDNVPTLEAVKEYSANDFDEHFKGVNREGLIEIWGDPAGSMSEENADMWNIDDESMVVIYWKDNGKFKDAGISIKEIAPVPADGECLELPDIEVTSAIFAPEDIITEIRNDITDEDTHSWTEAENTVINYEHIVPVYMPQQLTENDKTFSDTLAFSNQYIAPAISDGQCIGAFTIVKYNGEWVIDSYVAGLDIEAAIQQHKSTALCFVNIPQFGFEYGFLTVSDTGETYSSLTDTFDKISSGEELLERLREKVKQSNDETEG